LAADRPEEAALEAGLPAAVGLGVADVVLAVQAAADFRLPARYSEIADDEHSRFTGSFLSPSRTRL
jgi:hypothetical protein